MRKDISKTVEIPEGIEIKLEGETVIIKGPAGENKRKFNMKKINVEQNSNSLKLSYKKSTKKEKKMINTTIAHIKNMIEGVQNKFEYKLKICNSHFPMGVDIKGKEVLIKNFLGERVARKAKIVGGADVNIDKDIITVNSSNCEAAGQTAANLEKATWIRLRDRRVFQDGIFIISKPGRELE